MEKLIFKSRTTEVDAASVRIIGAYKKNNWTADTFMSAMFTDLETETNRLTRAINRSTAESILEEKDEVRDGRVRAIHFILLACENYPDESIQAAAHEVADVYNNYGLSITGLSYASESAMVNSLLGDLDDPALKPSVDLLPGFPAIAEGLKVAQTDFEQTRIAYEEEKGKEGIQDSATIIKKVVVNLINKKLLVYLQAMIQVNEVMYGDLSRTIAEIISENNEQVKKRSKRTVSVS